MSADSSGSGFGVWGAILALIIGIVLLRELIRIEKEKAAKKKSQLQ